MTRVRLVRLAAMLLGLAVASWAPAALAHTRSESHASWLVNGRSVAVTFAVSDAEARRLSPDGAAPADPVLVRYLAGHLGASVAEGACARAAPPRAVAAAAGFRRVELLFDCTSTKQMTLHTTAFFELVATHVNLAQVQDAQGNFVEEVLTGTSHDIAVDGGNGRGLAGAGFLTFIEMGILHIFTGVDHMAFLVGLVMISRRLRDLAFVVTGFTLGHSLTLALAVTGIVRPHAEFIDALVALTIALIGIENLAVATGRPRLFAAWTGGVLIAMTVMRLFGAGLLPPLLLVGAALFSANYLLISGTMRDAGRLRLVVTLVFGLIHGFGFAADLLDSRIPAERLAQLLIGFNLGVEMGQMTIVLLITGGVYLLARMNLALPRPIVVDVAASGLVGVGMFWFTARSFA